MNFIPTLEDVRQAAQRLKGVAHITPVMTSVTADVLTGARLFFKCEQFQRMGAFKFRGAYNTISRLSDEQKHNGVITYSSGNHAQATALSAKLAGIPATILMPSDSASSKVAATRGYGAKVIFYDRHTEDRDVLGRTLAQQHGLTMIPPYDHPHIVAGQGTAALELMESVPDLDYIITTLGGGGLLSGTAVAAKGLNPGCQVIGVEPVYGDDGRQSLAAGRVIRIAPPRGLPEGALATHVGDLNFSVIKELVSEIVTVSDEDIIDAMKFLAQRMKLVVEPTGALPFAAVLKGKIPVVGKRIGIIVSGGNVDLSRFGELVGSETEEVNSEIAI